MGKPFTAEQDAWLRRNHSAEKLIRELTAEFNAAFGEDRSADTMKHHCRKLMLQRNNRFFSEEEDRWLSEHSRDGSYLEVAAEFNRVFGQTRTPGVIKVHCNRALHAGFKNQKYSNSFPIGTEVIRCGFVWVKVSNIHCEKSGKLTSSVVNWRQKSHIVWEQHYGSAPPEGYTIAFLNRDTKDCRIENLYAVSPRVMREMSKKKWWSTDRELTLAAIRWCELFYAMKEAEGVRKNIQNGEKNGKS